MLNIPLRRIQGDKVVLEGKDFIELVRRAKRVEEVVLEEVDEDLRIEVDRPLRGSPQAVLSVLDSPSHCTPEDVNTLSQEIEQGKRSLQFEGIFDRGEERH